MNQETGNETEVLIIDEISRKLIQRLLERKLGVQITTCANGLES